MTVGEAELGGVEPAGGAEGAGPEGGDAPAAPPEARKRKRPDADPDAELLYSDMPLPSVDELRAALAWAFSGEDIAAALLDRFAAHAALVLEGNRRMNLTAIVDPREVAAKHYLDCWRATRLIPLIGRSLLDLGSGAGFPAIPIALTESACRVVALDSTQKRTGFVAESISALGVANASAVWERGEEHLARNVYDIVLMRAVSSVRENVRLLRKVRHSHKDLMMLKGASWSREVRAAEREAERLGFRLDTVWDHELPEGMGKRAILIYRAPGGAGL